MKKIIIGVMGPGSEAKKIDIEYARKLGELIAENGWTVLSGGINQGVMSAVNEGAKSKEGMTIGILPNDDVTTHSENLDYSIITNMKAGRNYINALSSNILIACGVSAGTVSEIAFAIQARKPIILLNYNIFARKFLKDLGKELIYVAKNPEDSINLIKNKILGDKR